MEIQWEIVTDESRFQSIVSGWSGLIAADCETYGERWSSNGKLLGISLSPEVSSNGVQGVYVPFNTFSGNLWTTYSSSYLRNYIHGSRLVGHNFTYDKCWIDKELGIGTNWGADTRLMWHLSSAPSGPRAYGLKDAMVEVLGWNADNESDLRLNVSGKGGDLRKGDHYLADIEVLAKYAVLDTYATIEVYKKLKGFFDSNNYWTLLSDMVSYNQLLEANTYNGVLVEVESLQKAHNRLLVTKEAAKNRFYKELKNEISELETEWADRKIAEYKRQYNKTWYANHPEEWEKFNFNSDPHKRELFYDKLGFTSPDLTPGGKSSVAGDTLKWCKHPAMASYLKYEKANTISTNFSGPYLKSIDSDSRLHPGFNICGTVSYRLSGFKPYLLNAPFDEKAILQHLRCDPGYIGVHADLSAIEPTITAHYSEDPALLKVFRDGQGDIYLDLALELFPNDKELQDGYNPWIPLSESIKRRFSKQRKIAKVIQLAVAYTGTGHTVSKNLTKDGIPTTVDEANRLVSAYWRKFRKVEEFNNRLRELNRKQGYLRNVIGRIIRVPDPGYKDLSNRFIQSSAHDVLILWVLEIYRISGLDGIELKPILLDCHDSTSNQCKRGTEDRVIEIYRRALDNVNRTLGLSVTVKAEIKTFETLAGLKADE